MEEQLEEVTVLQREMTGDWRDEAREMLLDFENRCFERAGAEDRGRKRRDRLVVFDENR